MSPARGPFFASKVFRTIQWGAQPRLRRAAVGKNAGGPGQPCRDTSRANELVNLILPPVSTFKPVIVLVVISTHHDDMTHDVTFAQAPPGSSGQNDRLRAALLLPKVSADDEGNARPRVSEAWVQVFHQTSPVPQRSSLKSDASRILARRAGRRKTWGLWRLSSSPAIASPWRRTHNATVSALQLVGKDRYGRNVFRQHTALLRISPVHQTRIRRRLRKNDPPMAAGIIGWSLHHRILHDFECATLLEQKSWRIMSAVPSGLDTLPQQTRDVPCPVPLKRHPTSCWEASFRRHPALIVFRLRRSQTTPKKTASHCRDMSRSARLGCRLPTADSSQPTRDISIALRLYRQGVRGKGDLVKASIAVRDRPPTMPRGTKRGYLLSAEGEGVKKTPTCATLRLDRGSISLDQDHCVRRLVQPR